jgi:hypothetical protein
VKFLMTYQWRKEKKGKKKTELCLWENYFEELRTVEDHINQILSNQESQMRIKIFCQEKKHNAYIIVLSECAYFNMSLDPPTYKLLYSKWDYTFNSCEPRAKEWIIISNEGYLEVSYDLSNLPSHHIQSSSHLASELLAREFDISIRDFNNKIQGDRKAVIRSTTFFVANCDLLVIPDDRDFMLKRSKTKRFSASLSRTLVFNPGAHFIKWVLKEKKRKKKSISSWSSMVSL